MKTALRKVRAVFNTKLRFFLLTVLLFAIKSYWAYQTKFTLGATGAVQQFLLAFNTIPSAIVFLGIGLYFLLGRGDFNRHLALPLCSRRYALL